MTKDDTQWALTCTISPIRDTVAAIRLTETLRDAFEGLPESDGIVNYWSNLAMKDEYPQRAIKAKFAGFNSEAQAKGFEAILMTKLRDNPELFGFGIASRCHTLTDEEDGLFPPRPKRGPHMRVTVDYGYANISVRCDGHLIRNFCGIEVPRKEAIARAEAYADGFRKALEFCAD